MSTKDGNESAFGVPPIVRPPKGVVLNEGSPGLTKREYVATSTLQGIIASGVTINAEKAVEQSNETADLMLKEWAG